ncbi:MAG TPA: hypothetical protein V6D00_15820 [Pantanalinema sp.]
MKVSWQRSALADVAALMPFPPHRRALKARLEGLLFIGQARPCASDRYPDAYFLKFKHWVVMFRVLDETSLDVLAVEYNLGQMI